MLPLRLYLENFGSFRDPTTVDFADADYFALVGPTGAGKTTILDAITFALYGSVPRWGQQQLVALALAPSVTTGRVALVFETGGRRYATVRFLARNPSGVVRTREARLDELDRSVPLSSDLHNLLQAVVQPLAEGKAVTAAVQELLGLEYRYFTQCVTLPQGRFAEFLHAAPRQRQELLVQLLDAEVYERIRQRAAWREQTAQHAALLARGQLAELTDADEAAERQAQARLQALEATAKEVRAALDGLTRYQEAVDQARQEHAAANRNLAALGALTKPRGVAKVAEQIRTAEQDAARLAEAVVQLEAAETRAEENLAHAGEKAALSKALEAHRTSDRLRTELAAQQTQLRMAASKAEALGVQLAQQQADLESAEAHHEAVRTAHDAADLASRLSVGQPCPVCHSPVSHLPHHPTPDDLDAAKQQVEEHKKALQQLRRSHGKAEVRAARLQEACEQTQAQLDALASLLDAHPDPAMLKRQLIAIEAAETAVATARTAVRQARKQREDADRRLQTLGRKAEKAWRELEVARDTVVPLGAPPLDRDDLERAWTLLLAWRDTAAERQQQAITTLAARLADDEQAHNQQYRAIVTRLAQDGLAVPDDASSAAISTAITEAVTRAAAHLDQVRHNRNLAQHLREQAARDEQTARVAHQLALLLRADRFEKWLCAEALDLLVSAASDILRELSGGQYELALSPKNDLEAVDYGEAGMRRSVRTLSGGETFQAALALALALSAEMASFAAAAARSLDAIFLDEGFGTLDPASLDTVAATLERLAASGERMVGIATHVPALAERIPVRFEVSRDGRGSHLKKVTA